MNKTLSPRVALTLLLVVAAGCQPASQAPPRPNATSTAIPTTSTTPLTPQPTADVAAHTPEELGQPSHRGDSWQKQFEQVQMGLSDTIRIQGRPITQLELLALRKLNGPLEQLLVDAGGVNTSTLENIASLKSLTHLRLRECELDDAGLEILASRGLPALQILNIPQNRFTAQGLALLSAFPKLTQVRLGGRQLDDAAVAELAKLPSLRSLHLIGPSLTDDALRELTQSPRLSSFYLDDCPLSDAAWEELFRAKPQLHVHVDQQHHDRDPHPDAHSLNLRRSQPDILVPHVTTAGKS